MYVFLFVYFLLFETEFHYLAEAGLQFTILLLHLPSAGIIGMYHHAWHSMFVLRQKREERREKSMIWKKRIK
jgi:hypothetical protein